MTVNQCACEICKAGSHPEIVHYHQQINLFLSRLTEPQRRWYVGLLAQQPDSPREGQLSLISGLDEKTIRRGRNELDLGLEGLPLTQQRRAGGGRWPAEKKTRSSKRSY
jgi:hypothetical protein